MKLNVHTHTHTYHRSHLSIEGQKDMRKRKPFNDTMKSRSFEVKWFVVLGFTVFTSGQCTEIGSSFRHHPIKEFDDNSSSVFIADFDIKIHVGMTVHP